MVMNCEGAGKLCGSLPWQVHFRLGAKDRGKKIFNKLKNMASGVGDFNWRAVV